MSIEKVPIDYLISDILFMKLNAHETRNEKLFECCGYLEKRFLQFKKGEIEFTREVPNNDD